MTKSSEFRLIGSFRFFPSTNELTNAAGQIVPLRPQTATILALLLARDGALVTKDEIMSEVWKDTHVTDDSLVQCISEIRKALGPADGRLLTTLPKRGYRLQPATTDPRGTRRNYRVAAAVAAVLLVSIAAAILVVGWRTAPSASTIAVLPFTNLSGETEQDYFSDGLAEDLLTDLSKITALTVLSGTSTFGYRDKKGGLQQIADDLGASHIVDGSVRREGDRIRISVQLVDARTGASLWAERYDREVGDLFDLQDEVRGRIIAALAVRLAPEDAKRLQGGGTTAFNAYDLLLRGRYAESSLTQSGVARAIEYYWQAIDADPAYADAYARLANMYDFAARFGWSDDSERDRLRSVQLAEQAVALEAGNPFVHWTYGRVISRLGRDMARRQAQAIEALTRAIELDPNYADAYAFVSLLHVGSGNPDAADAAMARAIRLNPKYPFWYAQNRGIIRYMQKDFQSAIVDFEYAVERNPTAVFTRWWLAAAYAEAGMQEDADWQVEEMKNLGFSSSAEEVIRSTAVIRDPVFAELLADGLRKAGISQ